MKSRIKKLTLLMLLSLCGCPGPTPPAPTPSPPPVLGVDTKIGLAPYAINSPNFQCAPFAQSIKGIAALHLSWLHNTFGPNGECLKQLLKDPRTKSFEVHVFNEVCVRNRNCGSYETLYGLNAGDYDYQLRSRNPDLLYRLKSEAQQLANFLYIDVKPTAKCYVSPGLESNLSISAMRVLIEELRPIFPGCEFVHNGVSSQTTGAGAELLEHHGNSPYYAPGQRCIANLDGVSIKFPEVLNGYVRQISVEQTNTYLESYRNRCDVTYLWSHVYNCILNSGQFLDPRARPCQDTQEFPLIARFVLERQ